MSKVTDLLKKLKGEKHEQEYLYSSSKIQMESWDKFFSVIQYCAKVSRQSLETQPAKLGSRFSRTSQIKARVKFKTLEGFREFETILETLKPKNKGVFA